MCSPAVFEPALLNFLDHWHTSWLNGLKHIRPNDNFYCPRRHRFESFWRVHNKNLSLLYFNLYMGNLFLKGEIFFKILILGFLFRFLCHFFFLLSLMSYIFIFCLKPRQQPEKIKIKKMFPFSHQIAETLKYTLHYEKERKNKKRFSPYPLLIRILVKINQLYTLLVSLPGTLPFLILHAVQPASSIIIEVLRGRHYWINQEHLNSRHYGTPDTCPANQEEILCFGHDFWNSTKMILTFLKLILKYDTDWWTSSFSVTPPYGTN